MADSTARPAAQDWRDRVLTDPEMILEDRDVMRALIAANERRMGDNVVDMRGIAMARLERRLDRLEDTHRNVIAAAYENLAGTNQIHRCVLKLLEAEDLGALLDALPGEIAQIVRVDCVRLVLESAEPGEAPHPTVARVAPGFVDGYLVGRRDVPVRRVTTRSCDGVSEAVFGAQAPTIASEALLKVDLGAGKLGAMLAFGAEDPQQFRSDQGTELLTFLADAFERILRRHLR